MYLTSFEILFGCMAIGSFVFIFLFLKSRFQKEVRELKSKHQTELNKELTNISQELHDNVGATLNIAHMLLSLPDDKRPDDVLDKAKNLIYHSQNNLSQIVSSNNKLAYPGPELVLKSLNWTITQFNTIRSDFNYNLEWNVQSNFSPMNVGIELFKILKELLNNTHKYAGSCTVEIKVNQKSNLSINCSYKEILFAHNNSINENAGTGMGLASIQTRVEKLNGEFNIEFGVEQNVGINANFHIPAAV